MAIVLIAVEDFGPDLLVFCFCFAFGPRICLAKRKRKRQRLMMMTTIVFLPRCRRWIIASPRIEKKRKKKIEKEMALKVAKKIALALYQ